MTRLASVIGIVMLVVAVAVPVMAWGPGLGRGYHMWGDRGTPAGCRQGSWGTNSNLSGEQQIRLDQIRQKYYNKTDNLRSEIRAKSLALNGILNSTEPDLEKARVLQKDISELRAKMDQERLNMHIETREVLPKGNYGALGYGKGYGKGNRGGRRGFGTGACWN